MSREMGADEVRMKGSCIQFGGGGGNMVEITIAAEAILKKMITTTSDRLPKPDPHRECLVRLVGSNGWVISKSKLAE
jgi:hypothetical protein